MELLDASNSEHRNPCQRLKDYLRKTNGPLFILVCLFAMSSWIDINAIWVELPLLVRSAPESWNLSSYMVIVIQIANVGPLVYTISKTVFPNRVKEWPLIIGTIALGIVASILLIFFWDDTTVWVGINEPRSTGLLVLSLFLSLVDCTSSVLYFPYMSFFESQYMTALFVGEGMSGLVPAILALAQLTDEDKWVSSTQNISEIRPLNKTFQNSATTSTIIFNDSSVTTNIPYSTNNSSFYGDYEIVWVTKATYETIYAKERFSISIYFLLIAILLSISLTSFLIIHFVPYFKLLRTENNSTPISLKRIGEATNKGHINDNSEASGRINTIIQDEYSNGNEVLNANDNSSHQNDDSKANLTDLDPPKNVDKREKVNFYLKAIGLLLITAWINGLTNGVLPALQTYSAQPYGFMAYNLHVKLSVLVNPLACFLALFLHFRQFWIVVVLTFMGSVLAAFQIALACLSPTPPLMGTSNGIASLVITQLLMTAIFSYTKVNIATIMSKIRGKHWLLFFGGATQLGSLIGAIIIFCIVNFTKTFKSQY